jgi:hypothetical protein
MPQQRHHCLEPSPAQLARPLRPYLRHSHSQVQRLVQSWARPLRPCLQQRLRHWQGPVMELYVAMPMGQRAMREEKGPV